jgi:hypothetical protein
MTRKEIRSERHGRLDAMSCAFDAWNLGGKRQPEGAPGK